MSALTGSAALAGAGTPCRDHGEPASARSVRRAIPTASPASRCAWTTCCSTTPRTASPPRRCGCCSTSPAQADVEGWRDRMFAGERINTTENRAVLHVALRNRSNRPVLVDGAGRHAGGQRRARADARLQRAGARRRLARPHRRRRITDVVNIGIGGSDLGPLMVCEALKPYQRRRPAAALRLQRRRRASGRTRCAGLDPARTLFIVASKTFTTQETMTNAASARAWLVERLGDERAVGQALRRGLDQRARRSPPSASTPPTCSASGTGSAAATRCGRRSACRSRSRSASSASRSCSPARHAMDEHFRTAPLERNLPVIAGPARRLVPQLPRRRQPRRAALRPAPPPPAGLPPAGRHGEQRQVGRSATAQPVDYATGPIIWGEPGTNGQHAFYQLIHQGTRADPGGLPRRRREPDAARRPPRQAARQLLRPDRGAGLRQDRRARRAPSSSARG